MKQHHFREARAGRRAVKVEGVEVAESFGDPRSEYVALAERAGIVDLGFRRRLLVRGADRAGFLHGMLSNDIKSLAPGEGCHALFLTIQGRVVADIIVSVERAQIVLDTMRGRISALAQGLERYVVADDVTLEAAGDGDHALGLFGPASDQVVSSLIGETVTLAKPYQFSEASCGEIILRLIRVPEPASGGFIIISRSSHVDELWQRLIEAGKGAGARPVGFAAYDSLRMESGQPWCGIDVTEETVAIEAGLENAISFNKGCYLGQEVVERVSSRGQINRRLSGLVLSREAVAGRGDKLTADGKDVGWLTSVGFSYKLSSPFALGYVRRGYWDEGGRLLLAEPASGHATVASLPV